MNTLHCLALLGAATVAASASAGSWTVEDVPTWRGDAGSAYYLWDTFTSANAADGPNFPNNEPFPSGNAMLFNFSEGAVVSGEGNIYGFGGPLNVHTYAYTAADALGVAININTAGSEINYAGVMLVWNDGIAGGASGMLMGDASINYWEEVDFGQGVGAIVNVSYNWDLSGIDADIRELGVIFAGTGPHMSLDMVGLDVLTVVPAPGVLALLGLAGVARRRRR
jgi:hypothetical protein